MTFGKPLKRPGPVPMTTAMSTPAESEVRCARFLNCLNVIARLMYQALLTVGAFIRKRDSQLARDMNPMVGLLQFGVLRCTYRPSCGPLEMHDYSCKVCNDALVQLLFRAALHVGRPRCVATIAVVQCLWATTRVGRSHRRFGSERCAGSTSTKPAVTSQQLSRMPQTKR